jgi:hypothetical protein
MGRSNGGEIDHEVNTMMSLNIGRSSEGEIEHEDGIYIIM